MTTLEVIVCPCAGTVVQINGANDTYVNEGDAIFTIRTSSGDLIQVTMELSGKIESIEVEVGDDVIPGMVLAYVQEDLFVAETDRK